MGTYLLNLETVSLFELAALCSYKFLGCVSRAYWLAPLCAARVDEQAWATLPFASAPPPWHRIILTSVVYAASASTTAFWVASIWCSLALAYFTVRVGLAPADTDTPLFVSFNLLFVFCLLVQNFGGVSYRRCQGACRYMEME
jgi:hypothetical protein